jgi:hypothetical protein
MPTLFAEEKRPQEKWFSALVASVCVVISAQTHTFTRWTFLYVYHFCALDAHNAECTAHTHADGALEESKVKAQERQDLQLVASANKYI